MNSLHRMLLSTNVKCPNMENCFLSSLEASKLTEKLWKSLSTIFSVKEI